MLKGALARLLRRPRWREGLERLGGFPRAEPSRRFDVPDLESVYRVVHDHGGALDLDRETVGENLRALARLAQAVARRGMVVVEVGSWKGASTAVLAHVARTHGGRVFAVDHWRGSPGLPHHTQARELDVLSVFRRNLRSLGLDDVVYPMVMPSAVAAELFPPETADLVFIDADHRYQTVRDDLEHWQPKLRRGGILCGHDSETYYGRLSPGEQRLVDEHREQDTVGRLHPGVLRALYDVFADAHTIVPGTTIWYLPTDTMP
jgi:predicted O-methyltransferase YrrM